MNLFLNTGLFMRTETPASCRRDRARSRPHCGRPSEPGRRRAAQAAAETILAAVLGAAAAVVGAPGLGTAIIAGGQTTPRLA